jgi:hypothetical protein
MNTQKQSKHFIHDSFYSFLSKELSDFDTIIISPRLLAMMQFLGQQTQSTDTETGAFVIKTGLGMNGQVGVRLVNIVGGEDRAINLEPQENLLPGEEYLGTFHAHPITDTPSVHDFMTFLADPTEQIMLLMGSDSTVNLALKTPNTVQVPTDQIDQLKQEYADWKDTDDKIALADKFRFNLYQGKDNELSRANTDTPKTGKSIQLDELALGLHGANQFPQQTTRKNPVKKLFVGTVVEYVAFLEDGYKGELRKAVDYGMRIEDKEKIAKAIERVVLEERLKEISK